MQDNLSLVVPFFRSEPFQDIEASQREGRPIFREREICEMRIAGDRNFRPVVPAHDMWTRIDGEEVTYAQRFSDAYARFKENREQIAVGTPLSELPFLTESKRAELRALNVHTAEALASLDGKPLSNLGMQGRELKTQATAYLENATGSAASTAMAKELALLRAELAEMKAGGAPDYDVIPEPEVAVADDADEREELKVQIQTLTGQRPRGNPSVATLKETLADLQQDA